MTLPKDYVLKRLEEDPDFVALKRFNYSLKNVLERYPDGAPDKIIANALLMPLEAVERTYQRAVAKLRSKLRVEED